MDKKIIRGIRIGEKVYIAGTEDELLEVLSNDELKVLLERGAITGEWVKAKPIKTTGKK